MKKNAIVVSLLAWAWLAPAEAAQMDLAIAAVVGQEAVSSYDVDSRLKFIIHTTKLPDTPDVLTRIRPQVVRSLIDERLQLQNAAKHGITVGDQDVAAAIAEIEKERGMEAGSIFQMMQRQQIPKETFTQQIRAQLAWRTLVLKKLRPNVRISDEEVQLMQKSAAVSVVVQELKIATLTLPVDNPSRETEVRNVSERLAREILAGASFEEVARQFSGKSAPFWVRPDQLDPMLARALTSAKAGMVTPPARTGGGYTIVKVYDVRTAESALPTDTEVQLKEILLKLKPDASQSEADALLQIGEEVAKHPGACEEEGVASIDDLDAFDIEVNFHRSMVSTLSPAVRAIAGSLKVGEISSPFASQEGIRLYMLCGRRENAVPEAVTDRIRNQLFHQKIELEAQKYMRNLRRETFIEIR